MVRSPARWLAPLALVACAVAVLLIFSSGSGSSDDASPAPGATGTTTAQTSTTEQRPRHRRSYTVKPGDVLSAIAEKTGVPLDEIQRLNPDVDAQSLHAGQKIKLAP